MNLSEDSACQFDLPRKSQPFEERRHALFHPHQLTQPLPSSLSLLRNPVGRGSCILGGDSGISRKSFLWRKDFLSLLWDLAQGVPLLTCFSVHSGLLRSPAGQCPPSEWALLAAEMVSPLLRKPLSELVGEAQQGESTWAESPSPQPTPSSHYPPAVWGAVEGELANVCAS